MLTYFSITFVVVGPSCLCFRSDKQKVIFCVTCHLRYHKQPQLDGKAFKLHVSLRQAFLRRQNIMQYEYSSTNIHNKVNMSAYSIRPIIYIYE